MYLIFGGECYYAAGGGYDLLGRTEGREAALKFAERTIGKEGVEPLSDAQESLGDGPSCTTIEWSHVFDVEAGAIIATYGDMPLGGGTMFAEIREPQA